MFIGTPCIKIRKSEFVAKLCAVGLNFNQTFLNLGVEFWMFGQ